MPGVENNKNGKPAGKDKPHAAPKKKATPKHTPVNKEKKKIDRHGNSGIRDQSKNDPEYIDEPEDAEEAQIEEPPEKGENPLKKVNKTFYK